MIQIWPAGTAHWHRLGPCQSGNFIFQQRVALIAACLLAVMAGTIAAATNQHTKPASPFSTALATGMGKIGIVYRRFSVGTLVNYLISQPAKAALYLVFVGKTCMVTAYGYGHLFHLTAVCLNPCVSTPNLVSRSPIKSLISFQMLHRRYV